MSAPGTLKGKEEKKPDLSSREKFSNKLTKDLNEILLLLFSVAFPVPEEYKNKVFDIEGVQYNAKFLGCSGTWIIKHFGEAFDKAKSAGKEEEMCTQIEVVINNFASQITQGVIKDLVMPSGDVEQMLNNIKHKTLNHFQVAHVNFNKDYFVSQILELFGREVIKLKLGQKPYFAIGSPLRSQGAGDAKFDAAQQNVSDAVADKPKDESGSSDPRPQARLF